MQKILIVEDDTNINNLLQEALSKEGYSCEQAFSGTEAKLLLNMQDHDYALVLLDLMLPGISGEAVLEEIRKKGNLPIIVLTAKDSLDEKVEVLTSGADDYITKPFEIREVLARVQVQLRHKEEKEAEEQHTLSFKDMLLNRDTFQVEIDGKIRRLQNRSLRFWNYCSEIRSRFSVKRIFSNMHGTSLIWVRRRHWTYISAISARRSNK